MSSLQPRRPDRHAKVQIPRLDRPREPPPKKPTVPRQGRVSRACMSCRARKIKCNGKQPQCQNCHESQIACVYVASRKDRLKTATEHNQDLLQLLQELRQNASSQEQQRIDSLLAATTEDVADAAYTLHKSPDKSPGNKQDFSDDNEGDMDGDQPGEAQVTAEVGSNHGMDNMDEDLLRTERSRATGYMGKNSEVQWLRTLHQEADTPHKGFEGPFGPPGDSAQAHDERIDAMHQRQQRSSTDHMNTNSCSFYLDDEPLAIDFIVDPYELPDFPMAERLFKCFMSTVQTSFPFLSQKTFTKQFYHYYTSVAHGTPYAVPQKWQVMLNLVFAIGAVHSHLIEADWRADSKDHLLYHSRAWALSLSDPWWITHPDLAQIQITGLLALYYTSIGHINRSWVVIGMAMRFGFSLGLHIRNEDRSATTVKKEILSRIWWAVYSLDRILSAITGRPSIGAEIYCSTSLPLPISAADIDETTIEAKFGKPPKWTNMHARLNTDGSRSPSASTETPNLEFEPANGGTFLTSTVKLGMLSNDVIAQLYSPSLATRSWKYVQGRITKMLEDLDLWLSSLPKGLNPFEDNGSPYSMQQERNILRTYYHSTKILICRPCLCRLDRRIQSQTEVSDRFNHNIAVQCVLSAKSIAACLPDDMAVWNKEIYRIFPWWAAVHYVMQAVAILLLEACYEAEGMDILPALKKLVRWLRALRFSNGAANRAYTITVDLLKKLITRDFNDPKIPQELSELLTEDPDPCSLADLSPNTSQWFTGEDYLERLPLPTFPDVPYADPSTESIPTHNYYSEATEPSFPEGSRQPLQGFFHDALNSRSPLANVFLTNFDQMNPLPARTEDTYMQDNVPDAGEAGHQNYSRSSY